VIRQLGTGEDVAPRSSRHQRDRRDSGRKSLAGAGLPPLSMLGRRGPGSPTSGSQPDWKHGSASGRAGSRTQRVARAGSRHQGLPGTARRTGPGIGPRRTGDPSSVLIIGRGDWEKHRSGLVVNILLGWVGFLVYFRFPWLLRGRSILGSQRGKPWASAIIAFECCSDFAGDSSWDRGYCRMDSAGHWRPPPSPLRDRQGPPRIRLIAKNFIWWGLIKACRWSTFYHGGSRWGGAAIPDESCSCSSSPTNPRRESSALLLQNRPIPPRW